VAIYPVIKAGQIAGWKRGTAIKDISELEQELAKIRLESVSSGVPTVTSLPVQSTGTQNIQSSGRVMISEWNKPLNYVASSKVRRQSYIEFP
jgi:hypothetical protein